jgi:hypothetical protein
MISVLIEFLDQRKNLPFCSKKNPFSLKWGIKQHQKFLCFTVT